MTLYDLTLKSGRSAKELISLSHVTSYGRVEPGSYDTEEQMLGNTAINDREHNMAGHFNHLTELNRSRASARFEASTPVTVRRFQNLDSMSTI